MNVSLTPELDKFVAAKVDSGLYNSASEVVREALRLLEEHDRGRMTWGNTSSLMPFGSGCSSGRRHGKSAGHEVRLWRSSQAWQPVVKIRF